MIVFQLCDIVDHSALVQLIQAGIRELKEEVGIQVNDEEAEHAETLGLWEVR